MYLIGKFIDYSYRSFILDYYLMHACVYIKLKNYKNKRYIFHCLHFLKLVINLFLTVQIIFINEKIIALSTALNEYFFPSVLSAINKSAYS